MKHQTRILLGLSIIFLILIGLSATIYFNSKDLDCNKCEIEFKNTEFSGVILEVPTIIKVNLKELNNSCPIRWSRTHGYYYGN